MTLKSCLVSKPVFYQLNATHRNSTLNDFNDLILCPRRNVNGIYRIALFSLRDIQPNTELTYDYNFHAYNLDSQVTCISDLFRLSALLSSTAAAFKQNIISADDHVSRAVPALKTLFFQQICKCGSSNCRGVMGDRSQRLNGGPGKDGALRMLGRQPKNKRKTKLKKTNVKVHILLAIS